VSEEPQGRQVGSGPAEKARDEDQRPGKPTQFGFLVLEFVFGDEKLKALHGYFVLAAAPVVWIEVAAGSAADGLTGAGWLRSCCSKVLKSLSRSKT